LALAIQRHLAPSLRKEYSYTFTPFLGSYDLFLFEPYLLPGRRVRRSLLQFIMHRTAVVVIAVLIAGTSGRTVLRYGLSVFVRAVRIVQNAKDTNI
jgi:hypothetical protein